MTTAPTRARTERLVRAAAAGDQRAWDALVREFDPVLRGVARGFRLDPHQVEDVVQATWLRLVLNIHRIDQPAAIPGWLTTTARREALASFQPTAREVLCDDVPAAEDATVSPTEEHVLRNERRDALRAALRRLPASHRAVAEALVSESARGYGAVAAELGIPVGSIGPLRARCIDRLRRDPALGLAVA